MPTYKVAVSVAIAGEQVVQAEDQERAKELALAQFAATGEPPQTFQAWVEEVEELQPAPKPQEGITMLDEMCPDHDIPLVILNGGTRKLCSICMGATGGTE